MRALEFLFEAGLANNELRKHGGKYIDLLVNKIKAGDSLETVPAAKDTLGDRVTIDPSEATKIAQAYFGQDEVPALDTVQLADNGDVVPVNPDQVRSLRLQTTDGQPITTAMLQKNSEFKGGKNFNTGDIAEGALGAAVAAKFGLRGAEVSEEDVINVLRKMGDPKLVGRNNMFSELEFTAGNDKIKYILGLNKASFEALIDAANGSMPNEILGAIRSSVKYVNGNEGVKASVDYAVNDEGPNSIEINADGVSDQRGVKADLFLTMDGQTVNLLSLKAGDVKQFGQVSGYNFPQIQKFFDETFGVTVGSSHEDEFVPGDAKASFEAIRNVYTGVTQKIQRELAGDNDANEAKFVERLYRGIEHHATRGEDGTSLVILKATPNAAGYTELQFGQKLRDAMELVDLDAEMVSDGPGKPAKLQIYGTTEDNKRALLLQVRSNYKSEGKGYVRNIVEMGPLLKQLALVQKEM